MARLTLTLLGGFEGRLDESHPLSLSARKAWALLAYLAVPPGRAHPRDKLAALLWGGVPEPQARTSLRQALFALRRALGEAAPLLVMEGEGVSLAAPGVAVDAVRFEQGLGADGRVPLESAVELYRGDLLAGLAVDEPPFEEWLMAQRERLRELALEGLARLLARQRAAGALEAGVTPRSACSPSTRCRRWDTAPSCGSMPRSAAVATRSASTGSASPCSRAS